MSGQFVGNTYKNSCWVWHVGTIFR